MSKIAALQNDIIEGIKKIESFNENDRLKVHKIYTDIYGKYLKLSKDDFTDDYFYNQHFKFVASSSERHKMEIKNLLDEEYLIDVKDNFFQIKMSLRGMLPHKIGN